MKMKLKDYFSNVRRDFNVDSAINSGNKTTLPAGQCHGYYAEFSDGIIGLGAVHGRLIVLHNDDVFYVDDLRSVRHEATEASRTLVIETQTEQIRIEFGKANGLISTPFYSEDEEDADFGLWLSNVLNSPERRLLIKDSFSRGF